MRSSGLPTTVSALLKLDAVGMGGGAWMAVRGRFGGEWLFVGSDTECMCLASWRVAVTTLRELVLVRAESNGDGEAAKGSVGVGGHRGLLGSVMGLEMLSLSIAELDLLRLDLRFLLIESVSLAMLVKEKARVLRVRGVREAKPRGGVLSPMGMRSSTSLLDRFSDRTVASSNIFALAEVAGSREQLAGHGGTERRLTGAIVCLLASPGARVKANHRVQSLRCAKRVSVDIHGSGQSRDAGPSTQPVKVCRSSAANNSVDENQVRGAQSIFGSRKVFKEATLTCCPATSTAKPHMQGPSRSIAVLSRCS